MAKKKNPFLDFKDRYAGDIDTDAGMYKSLAKSMAKRYENTYNAILADIHKARKEVNYATYAKQTQLLKQVAQHLDGFKGTAGKYFSEALEEVAAYGTKIAVKDLEVLGTDITKAEEWHYNFNKDYADKVHTDTYSHIAAQTDKMHNSVKLMLRKESAKIMRRAAVEGLPRKEAYRKLKASIAESDPEFKFTDKSGRNWDTGKYLNMLTRTVMANTLNEVYTNTLTNEGHDLVKVSVRGATDPCKHWEGKVLSITGKTEGYPTVAAAMATKEVFHPNCRHRLVAYHPDIEEVFEAVDKGATDEEVLGFDWDAYVNPSAQEKAKEELDKLNPAPMDGYYFNPMPWANGEEIEALKETKKMLPSPPVSTQRLPIDQLKVTDTYVHKPTAAKYIDNPDGINTGMTPSVAKAGVIYYVQGAHMKILAAKLMGWKHLNLEVHDLDAAEMEKFKKDAEEAKAKAEAEAKAAAKKKAEEEAKAEAPKTTCPKCGGKFKSPMSMKVHFKLKHGMTYNEYIGGASAKTEAEPKTPPKAATAVKPAVQDFDEDAFEKIGPAKGSNPGGVYRHKETGEKYYIKIPKTDKHARNEFLAGELYKMAHVDVPELSMFRMKDGKMAIASKWIDDVETVESIGASNLSKNDKKKAHMGFAADAWLANWDVAGLTHDNLGYGGEEYNPIRLDVGGALLFRAQGGPKGDAFGDKVTELDTLRDQAKNPQSAKIFGDISHDDLAESLRRVKSVSRKQIEDSIKRAGFTGSTAEQLKKTLFNRKLDLEVRLLDLLGEKPKTKPAPRSKSSHWSMAEPSEADYKNFKRNWGSGSYYGPKIAAIKRDFAQQGMTREEALAIVLYTNGVYGELNGQLRNRREDSNNAPKLSSFVRILNSGLRKMAAKNKTYGYTGTAARGMHLSRQEKFADKWKVGSVNRILSVWSHSKGESAAFGGNTFVYTKLKTPHAYIGKYSCHPSEREVIVPPGTVLKCTKQERVGGRLLVHLEEVDESELN